MGNSQHKSNLRKSQSVPDTQRLPPDAPVLLKEKSQSQQRLDINHGKSGKSGKGGKKHKVPQEDLPQIPQTDAAFLPDFPLRGDLEEMDFEVVDVIAKGAYGNVIKVQREDQKRFYAMKVLDKVQILQEGAIRQCKDEAAIQSMAGDHHFVVKAHEYWQSHRYLYIVLDYIPHGDMFTLWTFHGAFPESLVKLYIAEMAMVIDYLHNSSVIYRDVKMENILFDAKGHIQLTDFGLAKWLQGGEQTRTVCGTLQYMAPEVLSVYPYDHSADWWSVGILMYAMLAGKYPVDGADTHTKMAQKVFDCDFLLPNNISDSAQDVINRLLTKSPHKRLCDMDFLQDLAFFQDIYFTDLIDQKLNPIEVVPEDFFPMTGVSWAPQVLTPEEQHHFSQFDDSSETITNEPGYHHDHQYPHQRQPHPAHHHPVPIPRHQPAQFHDLKPKPQPHARQHSLPSEQHSQPLPQHQPQHDPQFTRQASQLSNNEQQQHPKQFVDVSVALSSRNSAQYSQNADYNVAQHDRRLVQSTSDAISSGFRQNSIPQPTPRGPSDFNYQNSVSVGDTARSGGPAPYNDNTIRSNTSTDRRSSGGSNGGIGSGGSRAYNQNSINTMGAVRRASSGDGLTSGGFGYTASPTSPVDNGFVNNLGNNINGQANANRISPSGGYKTVEAPPTVTLKSPMAGYSPSQSGFNQSQPSYNSPTSPTNPTSPGYVPQTYNTNSQPVRYGSSVPGSNYQNQAAFNSQPYSPTVNAYQTAGFNAPSSFLYSDHGFKTVEAPPTITMPTKPNNLGSNPNSMFQRDMHQSYQPAANIPASAPITLPYSNSNSRRVEEASVTLNAAPLMQAPQVRAPPQGQAPQVRAPSQGPVVPPKPVPPQKPTVPVKPSAPVRPIPAPRKSLRGQNPLLNPGSNQNQPGSSAPSQVSGSLGFDRGSYNPNFNQRPQNPGAPINTSMASNSSYQPPDHRTAPHPQSRAVPHPQSLPIAVSDQGRPRSGSSPNIMPGSGYPEPATPTKSPSLENNSFKWKLPANHTPSFV